MLENDPFDVPPIISSRGNFFHNIESNRHPFIRVIRKKKKATAKEIAEELKLPQEDVLFHLNQLVDAGQVIQQGQESPSTYSLHPDRQKPSPPDEEPHFDQKV